MCPVAESDKQLAERDVGVAITEIAKSEARRLGHWEAGSGHLVLALQRLDGEIANVFAKKGISTSKLESKLTLFYPRGKVLTDSDDVGLTPLAETFLKQAAGTAARGYRNIRSLDVYDAIISTGDCVGTRILWMIDQDPHQIHKEVVESLITG